jgi:hypothetical protein
LDNLDWNAEAKKLAKHIKAESGLSWTEIAEKISLLEPDTTAINPQTFRNQMNAGNFNVRLLLKIAKALDLQVELKKRV